MVGLLLAAGCASSPWAASEPAARPPLPETTQLPATAPPVVAAPPTQQPAAQPATPSPSEAQVAQEIMAELQQLGTLDPAARDELTAALQQTDPTLLPLFLQTVRARLAYRRRVEQQETALADRRGPTAALPVAGPANPGGLAPRRRDALSLPQSLPPSPAAPSNQLTPSGQASGPLGRLPVAGSNVVPPRESPPGNYPNTNQPPIAPPVTPPVTPSASSYLVNRPQQGSTSPQYPSPPLSGTLQQPLIPPQSTPPPGLPQPWPPQQTPMQTSPQTLPQGMPQPPQPLLPPQAAAAQRSGAGASDGQVIAASFDSAVQEEWLAHVTSAIRALEAQTQGPAKTPEDVARHAQLRMLYLLAGRRDEAIRPIPAVAPATEESRKTQEFWTNELLGLATWLDSQRTPDAMTRAGEAKRMFDEAAAWLGETAPLEVRGMAFGTKLDSYGCYEPFPANEFAPGQDVLLYAEVENFAPESTAKGFHTSLRSSCAIFDSVGRRVDNHDFTTTEEYCRNRRRDYFIGYHLRLPDHLSPGSYMLKLTVEDLKSKKVGESSIDFSIKKAG